jgi:hypothetical protein
MVDADPSRLRLAPPSPECGVVVAPSGVSARVGDRNSPLAPSSLPGVPTSTTDWRGRVAGTVALALGVPFAVLTYLSFFYDGRQDIDLEQWVDSESSWDQEFMPNARWATEELCVEEPHCIQAVTSDTLTLYRFARREHAVEAAESFGDDGYLTGWIAVRYESDGLSGSQRTEFEYYISCINTWVGEEGQDC